MSSESDLGDVVRRFADGDLSLIPELREASREALDELARSTGRYVLKLSQLREFLQRLPLDKASQHRARIWAYFWQEGQFPQQFEGVSPSFDTDFETSTLKVAEVMGVLWELGDDDVGWLDEEWRASLLELLSE